MDNRKATKISLEGIQTEITMLSHEIEAVKIILEEITRFTSEEDFNKAVNRLLAVVGDYMDAERVYIFEDRGEFYPNTYEWCKPGIESEIDTLQNVTREEASPWIERLEKGECIYISDVEEIKDTVPDIYALLHRQKINRVVEAPIKMDNRLFGFLGVDNAPNEITGLIIDALSMLGTFLGMSMQLRKERANIQKKNLALIQEQKRYRDALSNSSEYCYSFDVNDGRIYEEVVTAHGGRLAEELGLMLPVSFDDLNQKYLSYFGVEILDKESARIFTCEGLLEQYDNGVTSVESEYYSPVADRYLRVCMLLSKDDATGHVYAVVIANDTTEARKKEDRQLHELKEMGRQLEYANHEMNLQLETVLGGIAGGFKISRDDRDYSFVYVSEGAALIQGYTAEEFLEASGGSVLSNCYHEDREYTRLALEAQHARGEVHYVKYRVRHRDGSLKWIIDSGKRVIGPDGDVRHYSLVQDVTELEERNIALKDANEMQAQMLDSISCGVLAYKVPEHELIVVNDAAKEIIESGSSDVMEDVGRFYTQSIIPEDREIANGMADGLKEPGESAQNKFRVRRSDGSLMVVQCNTKLLQFTNGQRYILSSMLDITEQTNLEWLLTAERGQYKDALLDGAELSFSVDLTKGYLQDAVHTKDGEIPAERISMTAPVCYDDMLDKWIGQRQITPLNAARGMGLHRKELLERYEGGDTRVEEEYYSAKYDEYYNILILLSKVHEKDHVHAIFIVYNITEARKAEQLHKNQLIEAKETLSVVNRELQTSLRSEREKTAVIGAMSNIYYCSYLIDLRNETISTVSSIGYMDRIFSHRATEALRLWIDQLLDESFREDMRAFADLATVPERMRDTQIVNMDCISKKAGWIRVSFIAVSRDEEGNVYRVLWAAQHIDAEKQIELAQQEALRTAYESASRANSAKTKFLANMSHDIRTPMNAIIGMTAIAGTHLDDRERVADCLGKITVSSKHLLGLINEVLDMSKIESGKIELHEEEFSIPDLIDNLLSMVKPQVKAKNHELSVTIRGIEHEKVIADSQRIQQSFMNLMSNAVKYTPDGGKIALTISEKPMDKSQVGCYEFIFEDNGIGMSEEFLEHFFEPFTRATDSRVEKIQGTGLGMAITRNIVQMMNGDIKVESRLNEGTKITVTIVMQLQNPDEHIAYDAFSDLPILVADDDESACESTCEVLEELGMNGEWVLSGQEAVDLVVQRHEKKRDFFAVIIDWKMPEMDGIQTTKEIRRLIGQEVPIIIISAYDWADIELEARAAGADAFVSKPLFKSRMAHVFNNLLERGQDEFGDASLENVINEDFTGRRALLVEDNELNAEIAGEILGMAGLVIDFAKDGKEALDIMTAAADDYYDIVFMDIQMPVMNGYDATVAIRALPRNYTKRVPIIAMTANAFVEDVQASRNAGMNQHMAKPIDFEQLMGVLHKWLG